MTWKKGDLGRFSSEKLARPTFEAVRQTGDTVEIWQHMCASPIHVPLTTFRRDCTKQWELTVPSYSDAVSADAVLAVKPGTQLKIRRAEGLERAYRATDLLWDDPHKAPFNTAEQTWELVQGATITIRSVRRNFASGLLKGERGDTLVILPTSFLALFGRRVRSYLEILLEED